MEIVAPIKQAIKRITPSPMLAFYRARKAKQTVDTSSYIRRGIHLAYEFLPLRDNRLPVENSNNVLKKYFDSHSSGRTIWKWEHYFDVYHRHLSKFRGRDVRVMEIGVLGGGSLEMWHAYFGSQCTVYGVDIDPACRQYEGERTKILIGDQQDRAFWHSVKSTVAPLDIIIDDGGHEAEQQIVTLEEMLPHTRSGAVYICEDVHQSNQMFLPYVSGIVTELSEFTFIPNTTETVSAVNNFQRYVSGIHSYPFITVIERRGIELRQLIAPKRGSLEQPA
jgi:hypothetical protein